MASTKWRLNVTAVNGGSIIVVSEFQFRTEVGVPLPFASGEATDSYGTTADADAGADSQLDNAWYSVDDTTDFWQYEYDTPVDIVSYVIAHYDPNATCAPKDWTFEYWNGSSWVVVDTRADETGWGSDGPQIREYPIGGGAYTLLDHINPPADPVGAENTSWRINITANQGGSKFNSMREVQFRSVAGVPELFSGGTALASSVYSPDDNPASEAADNTSGTHWYSDRHANNGNDWWRYDYAAPFQVASYTITVNFTSEAPKDFTLEAWNGSAWIVKDTRTAQTGWVVGTAREYTVPIVNDGDIDLPLFEVDSVGNTPEHTYLGGTLTLQAITLDATHIVTHPNNGLVSLPLFTNTGGVSSNDTLFTGDMTMPEWTMAGGINYDMALELFQVAAVGGIGSVGHGNIRPLAFVIDGGIDDNRTLALFEVDATGIAAELISGDITLLAFDVAGAIDAPLALPALTLSGQLVAGTLSGVDVTLPAFTLAATSGDDGDVNLPELAVAATADTGQVGSGALLLDKLTVDGVLYENGTANGAITLALFALDANGSPVTMIEGGVTLPALAVAGLAVAGTVAEAELTLPLMALNAEGYFDTVGTATIVLPLFVVAGAAGGAHAQDDALPVSTVVSLNTRLMAVTLYQGMAFNSAAQVNGITLVAGADGLVALTGDTDFGADIDAYALSGISDYKSDAFKRVLSGFVGYRAQGEMELTMITDEHHEHVYRLAPRQAQDTLHASRVKFGRGVQGRYWQWRVANKQGGDFELDQLTFEVDTLKRRI